MTKRSTNAPRITSGMTHVEIREAATETHKHCSECGEFKKLDDFHPQSKGFKGRNSKCRDCWNTYCKKWRDQPENKQRRKEINAQKYQEREDVRDAARDRYVKRNYGEEALELEQRRRNGDPCEVCGSNDTVSIDHCHQTKKGRGLLCAN